MSDVTIPRQVPNEADRDTAGFFEASRRGELAIRACGDCDGTLWVPRGYCRYCGSFNIIWKSIGLTGKAFTWTVVTHQVHPSHPVPYTLVMVEPDDAPTARLVGSIPGAVELTVGQPMACWFEELPNGAVLPNWRPVPADAAPTKNEDTEDNEEVAS